MAADPAPEAGLSLAEGSRLVLDTESGYVDKIDGTITVGELKANFAGDVSIADKADDAAVATDNVIVVVKKVSDGILNYTEDYRVLEAARDEITEIILGAK